MYYIPMLFNQKKKSHTNKNQNQNVHVVSSPKFHVLSNGTLGFAGSLIYYAQENGNCASIQPPFSAVRTQRTGKPSPPFEIQKSVKFWFRKQYFFTCICFEFVRDFCL
jgi:hypothetical protein